MSGHSKWSNIKHKKGAADARRSRIFTKLIKELTIAARMGGGGDISCNARLRLAVDKAKADSVPKDTIERAIKRGTGELEGTAIEEISYEGYGPGGVAVVVDCATDNKTRTVAELRTIFSKRGGNLGASGAVAWMFEKKGVIQIDAAGQTEDALMEKALDAGAEDLERVDDVFIVTTSFEGFVSVLDAFKKQGIPVKEAGFEMIPKNEVMITEAERAQTLMDFVEAIEEHDDVQNVWANFEIDEKVLEKMQEA